MKSHVTHFLLLLLVSAACRPNRVIPPTPIQPIADGSLLYANEFGALRLIKTEYEGGQLGRVRITPFGDVGFGDTLSFSTVFSDLGGVVRTVPGSFDWSFYDDANPPYAAAVLQRRNNGLGSDDHKKRNIFQWVSLNQNQRSGFLFFNSVVNGNVRRRLEEFNYYVRARNVQFIDRTSYLVTFSDYWHRETGKPRPSFIGVDDFVHYVIKYDFTAPDPTIGEVVASFRDQNFSNIQLFVSAKKNFYYLFGPRYESLGLSPWVVRASNSTFAYIPQVKGSQGYDRAPGQEAFAFDAHPRLDSVVAVSDNRYGTMLIELPQEKEDRFKIVSPIINHTDIVPAVNVQEAFYEHAWQIRFNHDGSRLAIATHVPSSPPVIAIWHIAENRLVKYTLPSVGGVNFTRVGKPAWDNRSPGKRFLFFFASDHRTNVGYLFYLDTDQTTPGPRAWAWDAIQLSDDLVLNAEQIRTASEIIQRRER